MRQIQYVYTEPRDLEGDCYEVAKATTEQTLRALDVGIRALSDTFIMARVAQMEREEEPDGEAFLSSPMGKRLAELHTDVIGVHMTLGRLLKGIAFDPKELDDIKVGLSD